MTYSIFKVSGNSMFPFLQSGDLVMTEPIKNKKIISGQCILVENIIHRFTPSKKIKGDRLLYFDNTNISQNDSIVIGRILQENTKIIVSNYNSPILICISKIISYLSIKNTEKSFLRYFWLIQLYFLARVHRITERFFQISKDNV